MAGVKYAYAPLTPAFLIVQKFFNHFGGTNIALPSP